MRLTWRPALDERVVSTFVSDDDLAFPPFPPVVLDDIVLWFGELKSVYQISTRCRVNGYDR